MNCEHDPEFVPTPEGPHYGKEICKKCGRFLRWVPKPETIERQQRNGQRLVSLRNDERLTAWERGFVASLDGQGPKVSPKQQAKLDSLAEKYGH